MLKRIPALFFRTVAGREAVRDWLHGLSADDRSRVGHAVRDVEYGWPVGMPLCRPLGDGMFEVRVELSGNRSARIFFYISASQRMVLLHAFFKKQQQTPKAELDIARRNKRTHERGAE